ncbi:MAG: hypothetical protein ABWX96_20120 [Propionibacteriaceae bacterium]
MTESPTPDQPTPDHSSDEQLPSTTGGPPQGGQELGDDLAQEAQTGISSPDADEHAGEEAPASEGHAPE